ncbi:MAG: hypothetical protein IIW72_02925 [Clostridia bacterium]|nr:hypothetical protein [Clostridia bacterium]
MTQEFSNWLVQNGLTEAFTTHAGDAFYVNKEKNFGVLRKNGVYGVKSFYLDDIIEIKICDDEKLVVTWDRMNSWRVMERSTRFSTSAVIMKITLRSREVIKLQIFKATNGKIARNSNNHVNLLNYACQIAQIVCNCACGR